METVNQELENKFWKLVLQFDLETWVISSPTEMYANANYRAIIDLGQSVIPLLLKDVVMSRRHWFMALNEITGAQPVKDEHAGQIALMAKDWAEWGYRNGYGDFRHDWRDDV